MLMIEPHDYRLLWIANLREKSQGLVRGEEQGKSLSSYQVLIDNINIFYVFNNSIRKTEILRLIARKYQYYQKLNNVVSITESCCHHQLQFNMSQYIIFNHRNSQFSNHRNHSICKTSDCFPFNFVIWKRKNLRKGLWGIRIARPVSFLDVTRLLLL